MQTVKSALLLGSGILLGAIGLAIGQVNTVPQIGVITAFNTAQDTYHSATVALPPAASATDFACIAGSSSKTIRVKEITLSGSAGTLVTVPISLVRRTTADTGGTAGTTTADWANNISKADTNSPTQTATLIAYAANPTINDSSPTYVKQGNVTIPVTSAGVVTDPLKWRFGLGYDFTTHSLVLRSAAQQACLNLNAVSISSGLLSASIMWTESSL